MDLQIYGVIGSENLTAAAVRAQLAGQSEPLTVHIHSEGGDAIEGLAICSVLRGYPGRVTVQVDGLAASAASVIACAGSELVMAEGAMLMLHNPHIEAKGDGDTLRGYADMVDAMAQSYAAEYARRMGCSVDVARALMARSDWSVGTWLTAQEALAQGLATKIGPPVRVQARTTSTPEALRKAHARSQASMDKDQLLQLLGLDGAADYESAEHAMINYLAGSEDPAEKRKAVLEAFTAAFGSDKPDAAAAKAALEEMKAALAKARAEQEAQPDPEEIKQEAAKAEAKLHADVAGWAKEGRINDTPEARATWLDRHRKGEAVKAVALIDPGTWTTSQRLAGGKVGTPVEVKTPDKPVNPVKARAQRLMAEARALGKGPDGLEIQTKIVKAS